MARPKALPEFGRLADERTIDYAPRLHGLRSMFGDHVFLFPAYSGSPMQAPPWRVGSINSFCVWILH